MMASKSLRRAAFLVTGFAVAFSGHGAQSQPALDRMLSDASLVENESCAVLQVNFNFPTQYLSHFPLNSGTELRIRIQTIDASSGSGAVFGRDSLPAPFSSVTEISEISYEGDRTEGPTLIITFSSAVYYQVAQAPDFRGVLVSYSADANNVSCTPGSQANLPETGPTGDAALDAARTAIAAEDYETAILLLIRFLQQPENPSTADAQELLGIARERNGQEARAKAEYEDYLRRYPTGEGADRVRQRLAGMLARAVPTLRGQSVRPATEPGATQWEANGSISAYYYRDELSTNVYDEDAQLTINTGATTNQNQLVSALYANLRARTQSFEARLRAAGSYTSDFLPDALDQNRVSTLYLEAFDTAQNVILRIGRQYRSSSGILGRIDGALLTGKISEQFHVNLVGGFPVDSTRDGLNLHRYNYGLSLDFSNLPWSAQIYGIRQLAEGGIDREAIGFESRYVSGAFTTFASLDYDVHFGQVNLALLNGNIVLAGKTTLNVAIDHRKSPLLRTSNALIGQAVTSVDDLLSTYTEDEIRQLALDRTATSTAVIVGLSHPFSERFSASFDVTAWTITSTPESGGVAAVPSSGTDTYYSGHFIGSNVFTEGDLGVLGLSYSDSASAKRYALDFNVRYPAMPMLRIGPRLRLSYRKSNVNDGTQKVAQPSLRVDFRFNRNVYFEIEGGASWRQDRVGTIRTQTWNYLANAGFRLDF